MHEHDPREHAAEREHRAAHRDLWLGSEVDPGEHHTETGVLHANFDHQRAGLLNIQPENILPTDPAGQKTAEIQEDQRRDHIHGKFPAAVCRHDAGDDYNDDNIGHDFTE